jgi:predicted P-loop ATPase
MPEILVDNSGFGEWKKQLIYGDSKRPLDLRENAYLIMKHHPVWKDRVGFDEFGQRLVLRDPPEIPGFAAGEWTGQHDLNFGLWCAQIMGCWFRSEKTIAQGVAMAASERPFHPVRDWFATLRWNGVPHLEDWLTDCLGVEKTAYAMRVGKFFMLNLVARIYDPGCICRSVVVLEGKQNRGKSESLRALAGEWFADSHLDLNTKDSFLQIQGVMLYEIQEMHAFSRADVSRVKEFVSGREDKYRPPYGARTVRVKRQCVFAASTNEEIYLRDWSGNTRYWPVRIETAGAIDAELVLQMREQLFAEACALHAKGARRHPTREEEASMFAPEQEERLVEHPWKWEIQQWLDSVGPADPNRVTTSDVLMGCLKFERSKLLEGHERDVGKIMRSLGWTRKRASTGSRGWFYQRPEATK